MAGADTLEAAIDSALDRAGAGKQRPKAKVVASIKALPSRIRSQLDGQTDGLFDPATGTVYIVRDALPTDPAAAIDRALWVLWHELAGHKGLSAAFPGDALARILAEADRNPKVKALADAIQADRAQTPGQEIDRAEAVEEALAELAAAIRTGDMAALEATWGVEGLDSTAGLISRIVRAIKAHIVKAFGGRMPYSDAQVRDLLADAWKQVSDGAAAPGPVRQSRRTGTHTSAVDPSVRYRVGRDGSLTIEAGDSAVRGILEGRGLTDKGVKRGGKLTFSPNQSPRIIAALAGDSNAVSRAGAVYSHTVGSDGTIVGAPPKFNTHAKLPALRRQLLRLAKEGERGRMWYEDSGRAILAMVGNDKAEARKFVQLLAIYSAQADIAPNFVFALRAWMQIKAGVPINVKTASQDRTAARVVRDGGEWTGEKTNNFYTNLMRAIDPEKYGADKMGVTGDMWMARAFEYPGDAPNDSQYRFIEVETNRISRELGWEPQQTQAAVWVALKTRMNSDREANRRVDAESIAAGDVTITDGVRKFNGKEGEANHRARWFADALKRDISDKQWGFGEYNYATAAHDYLGQISWEARPGRTSGSPMAWVNDAPIEVQVEYQEAIAAALRGDAGQDLLAAEIGLPTIDYINAPGVWQGEVSAGGQTMVALPLRKGAADYKRELAKRLAAGEDVSAEDRNMVDPDAQRMITAYAATLGRLLRQEGMGWHRPDYATTKRDANGAEIDIGRVLTTQEMVALEARVAELSDGGDIAFVSSPDGVRVLNFSTIENPRFNDIVVKAAEYALDSDAIHHRMFRVDGGLVTNNWEENPDGQGYLVAAAEAGHGSTSEWADRVLAPRIAKANADFARRHGRDAPRQSRRPGVRQSRRPSVAEVRAAVRAVDGQPYRAAGRRGRAGDGAAGGEGAPLGSFTPSPALRAALEGLGLSAPDLQESRDAAGFADAIAALKEGNRFHASVYVYPVDEYADMRLFLTADRGGGFALKGDDIVSVFARPGTEAAGGAVAMLELAKQLGGRRLDAFDTVLPKLYARAGFRPAARMSWNDEYAPEGWDKATYAEFNGGEPDVVFMAYDPAYEGEAASDEGQRTDDYDEAVRLQQAAASAARETAPVTDEAVLELLPEYGETVADSLDAERRLMNGDHVFAFHEMDEDGEPFEVTNTADLASFAPDQLLVLSRYVVAELAAPLQSRQRAPEPGTPTPLYVSRPVEDDGGLRAWAVDAGLSAPLPASEMHVTVLYSKGPVDVAGVPPREGGLTVRASGRPVQLRSALAMPVRAMALNDGHRRYRDAGGTHDYGAQYTPHVTLKYDPTPADIAAVEAAPPFRGTLKLGGEVQAVLQSSEERALQSRKTPAEGVIARTKKLALLRRRGYPVTSFKQSGSTWSKSIKDAKGEAITTIRRVLQDRMIDVRDAQEDIEAAIGQPLDDLQNLYQAENLMHGKAADGVRRVRERLVDPLKKAVAESGLSVKEIERFLWAQHALERNARIAKINPGMPDGGSGLTNAEAQQIIAAAGNNPKLAEISRLVQDVRIDTLNTLRNSGQITPEQYRALRGMYKFYVPLRGHKGEAGEGRVGAGRGIDMRGKPVQRALGRSTEPANILGELVGDAERAQVQAAKAEVGRTLLRAALAHPNPDFWVVEPVSVQPRYSEATGEVYMAVTSDVNDEETVIVKHQGQPYIVRLVDPQLRAAMKNLGVEGFEGVSKYLGWVNRWLSAVFTRYNPAFVPVNMLRDMIQGAIGVSSELGGKALAEVAAIYPRAAAGLYAEARGAGDANVPDAQKTMADWAREFLESGAATGYQVFTDPERLQQQIEREMAGFMQLVRSGQPVAAVAEAARNSALLQSVESANEIIENTMRLSVYVQQRRAGKSRAKAATYAKDLTVNFNRKGSGTAIGNALFVFFNASMQGAHRALRLLRNPKVLAGMGALAATQFALAMTMGAARYEDEEETLWEKIPDYVKQRALVIPLGYSDNGGARYIAIPMPYGFNLFPYIGGYPANLSSKTWRSRHNPVQKTMGDIARAGIDAFSVVPVGDAGWYFPTTMRIFANLNANVDDLGRRIRDEGAFDKFEGPRASKGRADTPELYKDIARILNRIGGGDDYTKPVVPMLDVAPEDIEYLLGTFGGGPATAVQQAWRGGERMGADLPVDFDDIPVARRVIGSQRKQQLDSTAYYDTREVYERGIARLRDTYAKEGEAAFYAQRDELGPMFDGIELDRYKTTAKDGRYRSGDVRTSDSGAPTLKPADGSLFDIYREASKQVTGYNKAIRALYSDESLSRLERRSEIERLQLERAVAMRRFVDEWNAKL